MRQGRDMVQGLLLTSAVMKTRSGLDPLLLLLTEGNSLPSPHSALQSLAPNSSSLLLHLLQARNVPRLPQPCLGHAKSICCCPFHTHFQRANKFTPWRSTSLSIVNQAERTNLAKTATKPCHCLERLHLTPKDIKYIILG